MPGLFSPAARLDRAILIRHIALCIAAVTTFLWPFSIGTANRVVWLVAFVTLTNCAAAMMGRAPGSLRAAQILSTALGITGWLALGSVTGGTESPFIAGFWLEIVLSALTFPCSGTVLVSGSALAALLGEWIFTRPSGSLVLLAVQCAFLSAMGIVTSLLTHRWLGAQRDLLRDQEELRRRLTSMEKELRGAQDPGMADESSVRLAHGIKNAVHALRGFAALAKEPTQGGERSLQAWDGLRACIDRLEETTRFALRRGEPSAGRGASFPAEARTSRTIEEVIREASLSYPRIRWRRRWPETLPRIAAPPNVVREALLNLVRNAAEAMGGEGEVIIETHDDAAVLVIAIRDHGAGLAHEDLAQLFIPGRSTKPEGSGLGLFLTQRMIESHGGFVRAVSIGRQGALFSMGLPVLGR